MIGLRPTLARPTAMPRRRLLIPALVAALLAALAATAHARTGPCLPEAPDGPRCTVWTGKATFIADGDTLDVNVGGDGRGVYRVRITGLNAPELRVYSSRASRRRGECHAVAAANRLEQLVRRARGRVRVSARRASSRSGKRWRRSVAVRSGGRWRDAGRVLVSEGHALFLPNTVETHANLLYSALAQRAAIAQRRVWSPSACGVGPSQGAGLRLTVNWDADSNDAQNVNGEWVRIHNPSAGDVAVGGWTVRDSSARRYRLPAGATVPARGAITVFAGRGASGRGRFFWGSRVAIFENVLPDKPGTGDGAYLYDPQGDLRASMTYPCRVACGRPAGVAIAADPDRDETITVRNGSGAPLALGDLRVEAYPYGYAFGPGETLAPGTSLVVETGGDPSDDTALRRHWGFDGPILANGGGRVRVTTYRGIEVACDAWGRERC